MYIYCFRLTLLYRCCMTTDCIFCNIAHGLQGEILYQVQEIVCVKDINPKAPYHFLIFPKKHISTINELKSDDTCMVGSMVYFASKIASKNKIEASGYRLVFNCNADGGQLVYHIHLHLLGGRNMLWPPG